jgi:glycyl-tRNA synthetase beta chain
LQGVMGRYYALHDGEPREAADAIRDHYAPRGPGEGAPASPVSMAVALADKLDLLAGFFAIGEKPTGSGDPYALRRAALGVIRIVRENGLRLNLLRLFHEAEVDLPAEVHTQELLAFIADRLRVQLRAEGERHDVLAAVFAAGADDDLVRLLARTEAVARFLASPDGANLLTGARRAANILRIEDKKDGPHRGDVDPDLLREPEEQGLDATLSHTEAVVRESLEREDFSGAMAALSQLRPTLDAFFDKVTVNAPDPALRSNRLRLLARVAAAMERAADFSRIEG